MTLGNFHIVVGLEYEKLSHHVARRHPWPIEFWYMYLCFKRNSNKTRQKILHSFNQDEHTHHYVGLTILISVCYVKYLSHLPFHIIQRS